MKNNNFETQDLGYVKAKAVVESQFGGPQLKISLGGGKSGFPLVHAYLDIEKIQNLINDDSLFTSDDYKLLTLGKATKIILKQNGFSNNQPKKQWSKPSQNTYQKRNGSEMENSPY